MSDLAMRARLARQLGEWDYDFARFEITDFVKWISARRRRPIRLLPIKLPGEMFGAWIKGDTADYIFYDYRSPQVHVVHTLLHELSHILLGHRTAHISSTVAQRLNDNADLTQAEAQEVISGLFRLAEDTSHQEAEAETLSTLIQHRVFRLAGLSALTRPSANEEMRHIVASLGMDR